MRDRASYAFALVSVAAALELARTARCATCGWRSAASRTSPGGPGPRRRRCAAVRPRRRAFRAAAEAELADAAGLRDNAFKIELAKRTITAVLQPELAGGAHEHDRHPATVQRHVPDALVPGASPTASGTSTAMIGAQVSRVDGPLKVRARRASPPRSRWRA